MNCPACDSRSTELFLRRAGVPVHQNFLFASAELARESARGDLDMTVCHACGFVFNAAFRPELITYGDDYDNNQICSPTFHDYVDGLVKHLVDELGVRGTTIAEVGCGKGYFLIKLVEADENNRGVGYDTSYIGPPDALDGRVVFHRRYFGAGETSIAPGLLLCRHVIEHVPDPREMLRCIRAALGDSERTLVVFETPSVRWILRNRVIWDFFYEHCSLFSAASLRALFEQCGFAVDEVREVFGEQYLWLEGRPAPSSPETSVAEGIVEECRDFAAHERELVADWTARIDAMASDGAVAVWGAGAKGVTFLNLVDPGRHRIDCVVDLNPRKHGHFVAGTGHPIVSHHDLRARGVKNVVQMNPNYEQENRALAAAAGLDLNFVV